MSTITLDLDEDLTALLRNGSDASVERTALELMVLELYRRRTITSGRAAEILGMPRGDFIEHASQLGIPFFVMTDEEWEAERQAIRAL